MNTTLRMQSIQPQLILIRALDHVAQNKKNKT